MKTTISILTFIFSVSVYGQNIESGKNCKVVQFVNKDSINSSSKINPIFNKRGFYLVTNCVYDFIIDGKKYFQSILLKIDNDKFYISKNWETKTDNEIISDTIAVSINQEIRIRTVSIDKGVGNIPSRTNPNKYNVTIVDSDYCRFQNAEILSKGNKYFGHYYFTEIGLKKLKIVNGKALLCEENGDFLLRRN
ncbi:hypothetical protein [Flavobacterium soyangense]|uniref:Uncharacterized protein n=1 Tax=Flavobacterium soyangense TaxID=2023265 RepID=A0A930UFT8_9FLAO|nr:hypothetical protein [Flavobacterium soyangense]MBF2710067.1 hypothetical protein [Flavobacterium soyangense]